MRKPNLKFSLKVIYPLKSASSRGLSAIAELPVFINHCGPISQFANKLSQQQHHWKSFESFTFNYFWFKIESQPAAQGEASRRTDFGEVLKEDRQCNF